jgi:hypothetical protein
MREDKILVSLSLEKKATERKYRRNRNVKDAATLGVKFRPRKYFSWGGEHGSGGITGLTFPQYVSRFRLSVKSAEESAETE